MGSVTRQGKRLFGCAGHGANPAFGPRQLKWPNGPFGRKLHAAQNIAAGLGQFGGECLFRQPHEFLRPQRVHRPDQCHFAPAFTAHRKQGQHFGLWLRQAWGLAPAKPLACHTLVRSITNQACGHSVLFVMRDVKTNTQLRTGLAGAALAHHRQRGSHRGLYHLNVRLKLDRCRQALFEHRDIHHPVEFAHALLLSSKSQLAAVVAPHLHLVHGRHGRAVGPATQVLQQGLGLAVERIGAHVRRCVSVGRFDQSHFQPFAGQQQGQSAAHNASASDANVGVISHMKIVEAPRLKCRIDSE